MRSAPLGGLIELGSNGNAAIRVPVGALGGVEAAASAGAAAVSVVVSVALPVVGAGAGAAQAASTIVNNNTNVSRSCLVRMMIFLINEVSEILAKRSCKSFRREEKLLIL
jgi:hypothetical protein